MPLSASTIGALPTTYKRAAALAAYPYEMGAMNAEVLKNGIVVFRFFSAKDRAESSALLNEWGIMRSAMGYAKLCDKCHSFPYLIYVPVDNKPVTIAALTQTK